MPDDDLTPTPEDLDFKGVTSRYADTIGVSIDRTKVPERFRHLLDYAKHWAIGDDVERSDLMWVTPNEELKAFVLAVLPFRDEIAEWWSSDVGGRPGSDEAVLFLMMLEAAREAEALHVDLEE